MELAESQGQAAEALAAVRAEATADTAAAVAAAEGGSAKALATLNEQLERERAKHADELLAAQEGGATAAAQAARKRSEALAAEVEDLQVSSSCGRPCRGRRE